MRVKDLGLGVLSLLLIAGCGNSDQPSDSEFSRYADPFFTPDTSAGPVQAPRSNTQNLLDQVSNPREWEMAGRLPKGLYDQASTVWNGALYVSGGFGPGTHEGSDVNTKEIYIFRILPDHTAALSNTATLPDRSLILEGGIHAAVTGIDGHAMVAWGGYLYLVGGKFQYVRTDCYPQTAHPCFTQTPTAWNRSILYAAIQPDGSLSDWKEIPIPKTVGAYTPGVAVSEGILYILGGWDGDRNADTVVSAPLLLDGSPGPWHAEYPLPVGLSKHAVAVSGHHLYVVGGSTGEAGQFVYSQGYSAEVYETTIQADGTLGPWNSGPPLPDTWIDHKMVAAGELLWVIGGRNVNEYYDFIGTYFDYIFHDQVLVAKIRDDGSLASWMVYNDLPSPRMRHSVADDGGLIYLIGGSSGQEVSLYECILSICGAPYIREDGIYFLDLSATFGSE